MGRLTLNVLLSFAQFEREVTAERIRDKFAASKARGMWMGGTLPLGYDVKDRALIINEQEAETVRHIFTRFIELKSVPQLAAELAGNGIRSKEWVSSRGRRRGGGKIGRGALYHMLGNCVYRGLISHKGKEFPGQHEAIVPYELWDSVQRNRAKISASAREHHASGALLQGRVFDAAGNLMSPSHTRKGARRYLYYVSAPLVRGAKATRTSALQRISAPALEAAVIAETMSLLCATWMPDVDARERTRSAVVRVSLSSKRLTILLNTDAVADEHRTQLKSENDGLVLDAATDLRRPRNATRLLHPSHEGRPHLDRVLVRAVAQAHRWAKQLESGEYASVAALARAQHLCVNRTSALLPLAYLAPDLVALILDGRQPRTMTIATLTDEALPLDWAGQRARFTTV